MIYLVLLLTDVRNDRTPQSISLAVERRSHRHELHNSIQFSVYATICRSLQFAVCVLMRFVIESLIKLMLFEAFGSCSMRHVLHNCCLLLAPRMNAILWHGALGFCYHFFLFSLWIESNWKRTQTSSGYNNERKLLEFQSEECVEWVADDSNQNWRILIQRGRTNTESKFNFGKTNCALLCLLVFAEPARFTYFPFNIVQNFVQSKYFRSFD